MQASEIIARKRDGRALDAAEIRAFIAAYTRGDVPDYQAAAFLMAVFLRGMTARETAALTAAMAASGAQLDWSDLLPYAVDKHSSGGVGDTTTLLALPLVAACDVPVAKMSGRGLGHSGGTLDKLEAIDGFRCQLSLAEMREQVKREGLALAGQSADLAPADGKLYALRDVTATVASVPLIVASIMSKKLAGGAQGVVLDVKVGNGAFCDTLAMGQQLARAMVAVGREAGRDVFVLLSDMNQPLGRAIGNALEVAEAARILRENAPGRLREHSLMVAAHMLRLAKRGLRLAEARALLEERLADGRAYEKLRRLVVTQGGDARQLDDERRLPRARLRAELRAPASGYLNGMDTEALGRACVLLGGGRARKEDQIDPAVGLVMRAELGDAIAAGAPLLTIYANDEERLAAAQAQLKAAAWQISAKRAAPPPLVYEVIAGEWG